MLTPTRPTKYPAMMNTMTRQHRGDALVDAVHARPAQPYTSSFSQHTCRCSVAIRRTPMQDMLYGCTLAKLAAHVRNTSTMRPSTELRNTCTKLSDLSRLFLCADVQGMFGTCAESLRLLTPQISCHMAGADEQATGSQITTDNAA